MLRKGSNTTDLANTTLTLPVEDPRPWAMTCPPNPLVPGSRTALVISTALLPGNMRGAVLIMAYILLFGKR
jgi:alpha/beta superfamily hydrolase